MFGTEMEEEKAKIAKAVASRALTISFLDLIKQHFTYSLIQSRSNKMRLDHEFEPPYL